MIEMVGGWWEVLRGLQQELSFGNPTPWLNLHFYLEFFFLGVIMYVVTRRMCSPKKKIASLTEAEIDARYATWKPVPLVPEGSVARRELVLEKACAATLQLQGDPKTYTNFASHNFLGLVGNAEVHDAAKAVIVKYGVGSCGPRGFYGSIDVHINCEEEIAKFKLEDVMARDKKKGGKINRQFIVCEGIYQNIGDVAPPPQLVELKKKYKFRLILDESTHVPH